MTAILGNWNLVNISMTHDSFESYGLVDPFDPRDPLSAALHATREINNA